MSGDAASTVLNAAPWSQAVKVNNKRFTGGNLRLVEANCENMPFSDGGAWLTRALNSKI